MATQPHVRSNSRPSDNDGSRYSDSGSIPSNSSKINYPVIKQIQDDRIDWQRIPPLHSGKKSSKKRVIPSSPVKEQECDDDLGTSYRRASFHRLARRDSRVNQKRVFEVLKEAARCKSANRDNDDGRRKQQEQGRQGQTRSSALSPNRMTGSSSTRQRTKPFSKTYPRSTQAGSVSVPPLPTPPLFGRDKNDSCCGISDPQDSKECIDELLGSVRQVARDDAATLLQATVRGYLCRLTTGPKKTLKKRTSPCRLWSEITMSDFGSAHSTRCQASIGDESSPDSRSCSEANDIFWLSDREVQDSSPQKSMAPNSSTPRCHDNLLDGDTDGDTDCTLFSSPSDKARRHASSSPTAVADMPVQPPSRRLSMSIRKEEQSSQPSSSSAVSLSSLDDSMAMFFDDEGTSSDDEMDMLLTLRASASTVEPSLPWMAMIPPRPSPRGVNEFPECGSTSWASLPTVRRHGTEARDVWGGGNQSFSSYFYSPRDEPAKIPKRCLSPPRGTPSFRQPPFE